MITAMNDLLVSTRRHALSRRRSIAAIVVFPISLLMTSTAFAADNHPYPTSLYIVVLIACYVILGPFAYANLVRGTFDRKIGIASGEWPAVSGKIVESKAINIFTWLDLFGFVFLFLSIIGGGGSSITVSAVEPVIRYEYELAGARHEGTMLRFGAPRFVSESQVSKLLAPFGVGREIVVHYDPSDPTLSVLDIGKNAASQRIMLGYIGLALPIVIVSLIGILDALR